MIYRYQPHPHFASQQLSIPRCEECPKSVQLSPFRNTSEAMWLEKFTIESYWRYSKRYCTCSIVRTYKWLPGMRYNYAKFSSGKRLCTYNNVFAHTNTAGYMCRKKKEEERKKRTKCWRERSCLKSETTCPSNHHHMSSRNMLILLSFFAAGGVSITALLTSKR